MQTFLIFTDLRWFMKVYRKTGYMVYRFTHPLKGVNRKPKTIKHSKRLNTPGMLARREDFRTISPMNYTRLFRAY